MEYLLLYLLSYSSQEDVVQLRYYLKKQLLKLIDHSNETSWTNNEVKELITNQLKDDLCQEKQVYGLLALLELPQNIDDVFL